MDVVCVLVAGFTMLGAEDRVVGAKVGVTVGEREGGNVGAGVRAFVGF